MSRIRQHIPLIIVLLAVCTAYVNHFQNGFHFDDAHTVVDNPYIRSLANLPRFFTDTTTFSVLPANRTYRPFVSASLALDYALGHGYKPFWFHLSTFLIYLAQLVCMYALFGGILRRVGAGESMGRIAALLATAWYGLHPVMAETVNYIIQRGDIYSTFGVVAGLAMYACWPRQRRWGLYLLPLAFALLSKPPAVVFPALLFLYIVLFEEEEQGSLSRAALACVPSVVLCAVLMGLQAHMTPKSYTPSMLSAFAYRITQPFVLLRYFGSFFLPLHLNVDTDLAAFPALNGLALLGFVFVWLVLVATWFTWRRRETRPIAFGLLWFLIASLPTSLYTLSEVENDHRMFLPFVGLALAVVWALALMLEKAVAARSNPASAHRAALVVSVALLAAYGYGTYRRNQVWRTDESLWLDDVQKCPHNGRGLMNYGLSQMGKGAYPAALEYFDRALKYTPNYPTLEINLGIVHGALYQPADAAAHFQRAITLAPSNDEAHFFFGRWLYQSGNLSQAIRELATAVALNPSRLESRALLATAYATAGDAAQARAAAQGILQIAPGDRGARLILAEQIAPSASYWVNASLYQYESGNYPGCITDANQAIAIKPDLAIGHLNLGACYAGLKAYPLAMQSEREALRLDPNNVLAKNNLEAYTRLAAQETAPKTAEDWLNASLRDHQAHDYQKSIADAREALRLRPDYAEAWNNIAAAYEEMHDWDHAIAAAQKAIQLKPDFQLAKNNLAWSESQKKAQVH